MIDDWSRLPAGIRQAICQHQRKQREKTQAALAAARRLP